jgi:hypothetical protein
MHATGEQKYLRSCCHDVYQMIVPQARMSKEQKHIPNLCQISLCTQSSQEKKEQLIIQATLPNSAARRREFSPAPAPVHTLLSCSIRLQKPMHLHEPVHTLISPNPRFHSTCRFLPCLPLAWILAVGYVGYRWKQSPKQKRNA